MKFKAKMLILVGGLAIVIITGLIVYLNIYLTKFQKEQMISNFHNLAELSKGAYFAFVESLKIRAIDWSSDGYIRSITKKITSSSLSEKEKKEAALTLGTYLKEEKMKYDPSIVMVDILDKEGIVVASSRPDRIGVNEKEEEEKFGAIRFKKAIKSQFGEAFVVSFVSEEDEHSEPMMHTTTRIFSSDMDEKGNLMPLDAVMLVHFVKNDELNDVLNRHFQEKQGALTGQALLNYYKTAEIYLVNKNKMMITPSRFLGEAVLSRTVDTLPVRACFEENKEIAGEYLNYMGKSVLGASVCVKQDNLALIVEANKDEVFAPIKKIRNQLLLSGLIVLILSGSGIWLAARILTEDLNRINERVTEALNKLLKLREEK